MTDQNAQQQEPSMEEILASIRRIISEDGEEAPQAAKPADAPAAAPQAEPAVEADEADEPDVLELTEVVEEHAPPPPAGRRMVEEEVRARPASRLIEEAPLTADEAALVSQTVANRTQASVAELVAAMGSTAPVGGRDTTVVDIVKTLLRPLLKDWLDQHLAGMVDEIVREEIERVVGRRHRR